MKYDIGVIVGRFQVWEFHAGHKHLLDKVYSAHKAMLVILGVSRAHGTLEDPLEFSLRQQMVKDMYPQATVLMIADIPGDDETWSRTLDEIITTAFPNRTYCLYGGRDSFVAKYHGAFHAEEIEPIHWASGTDIRNAVDARDADANFRRGVIYGIRYQYPRVMPTVDIALCTERSVLMGRKRNVTGLVLPGGFVSPSDESYEMAAVRELQEETGMCLAGGINDLRYIASMRVDDWRYRGRRDKITTTLFTAPYYSGVAKAADDLIDVEWIEMRHNALDRVADHHKPLFERLLSEVA